VDQEEYDALAKEIEGLDKDSLEKLFAEAATRLDLDVAYRADRLIRERFPTEQTWDEIMARWGRLGKLRRDVKKEEG
jgi:hypothetical protein